MRANLLVTTNKEIPRGEFSLGVTRHEIIPGERKLNEKDWKLIYEGNSDLVDSWVAIGLIRAIVTKKKQVIVFFNSEQDIPDLLK